MTPTLNVKVEKFIAVCVRWKKKLYNEIVTIFLRARLCCFHYFAGICSVKVLR